MTTIVGIRTPEGVVLASDLTGTRTDWQQQGDIYHKVQTKQDFQKIYSNSDFSVAMAGTYDQQFVEFLTRLLNGDIDLREHLSEGEFPGLNELHQTRWQGMMPTNDISHLVIASRFGNEPELYHSWPLGKTEAKTDIAIGSGHGFAESYMQERLRRPGTISLPDAIDIVVGSLDAASQDIYTGGLDLVVVTPDGITPFGSRINQSMQERKRLELDAIKKELS